MVVQRDGGWGEALVGGVLFWVVLLGTMWLVARGVDVLRVVLTWMVEAWRW
jgi:hypothetical protein